MAQLFGFVLVLALVTGALLMSGSQGVLKALPYELALILGAGAGTLLIGNSAATAKAAIAGFGKAVRGSKWRRSDYAEALSLLYDLTFRVSRRGVIAIESDIENPKDSALFQAAPRLNKDDTVREYICEAFRLQALDPSRKGAIDAHLERAIHAELDRRMKAVSALHTLADALPALGIVAAVLGIIRTMGAIDQSPAILGAMIATALLGTFLGVFLAYGLVGPLATRFGQVVEEETGMLDVVRAVLSAHASGLSPRAAVEIGRAMIPAEIQPRTDAIDHAIQARRFQAKAAA